MSNKLKGKLPIILSLVIIFIGFYIFYTVAHPMYIYDLDDWYYTYYSRSFFPTIKGWNPTRILPELLMPLVSGIASFVIYPITKDYISSLSYIYALTYSLFIVTYVFTLYKLLKSKFKTSEWIFVSLIFIFVMFHFYPYNIDKTGNPYLLSTGNITCYFYYMIPGLLNFSVVMYLASLNKDIQEWFLSKNNLAKSLFIFAIYFCINSSMFHSIILVSYLGCLLLNHLIVTIKNKNKFLDFIKNNLLSIVIIIIWLISILIESKGGRASSNVSSYAPHILTTVYALLSKLYAAKHSFWIIVVLSNTIAIVTSIVKKDYKYLNLIIKLALSCIICSIFLVLLCDVVETSYIQRTDVLISIYGWIVISVICSMNKIIEEYNITSLLLPFIIGGLMFTTIVDDLTYKDNYQSKYTANEVKQIDDYIVKQIEDAVNNSKEYVAIKFPNDEMAGWPQSPDCADRMTKALYLHGVVNKKIDATLVGVDLSEIIDDTNKEISEN